MTDATDDVESSPAPPHHQRARKPGPEDSFFSTLLERDIASGAVQATLERLERKGLVRSALGRGTPIRDGRARRFYTVLAEGLHELNEARTTHDTIWRGFVRPLKARG